MQDNYLYTIYNSSYFYDYEERESFDISTLIFAMLLFNFTVIILIHICHINP